MKLNAHHKLAGTFQDKEGKTREVKRELRLNLLTVIKSPCLHLMIWSKICQGRPSVMKQYCDELDYTPDQFKLLLGKGGIPLRLV